MTTTLRQLLDDVADDQLHTESVATRVRDEARHRQVRGRRMLAAGLAAACVIGLVLFVRQPWQAGPEPGPDVVAAIPAQLPAPAGLPSLADAPMAAASVAYVTDGQLVLVASNGAGAAVAGDLPAADLVPSSVALAPDGEHAVVSFSGGSSFHCCVGQLTYLLDVESGTWTSTGLQLATDREKAGWRWPQLVAWSPDSTRVALLVAVPRIGMVRSGQDPVRTEAHVVGVDGSQETVARGGYWAIAGAVHGLLAQTNPATGSWVQVPIDGWAQATTGSRSGNASSTAGPVVMDVQAMAFDVRGGTHWAGVAGSTIRVIGRVSFSPPSASLPGPLATLQSALEGFAVVTWPDGIGPGDAPPPLTVSFVDDQARITPLSQLPAGTTSFAAAGDRLLGPSS